MTHSLPLGPTSLAIRLGDADQERARAAWLERAGSERWAERLFERDTSLWTTDERVAASISERLGWLDAPAHFTDQIPALEGFGEGVRDAGFTSVIVAGMGGSSLAPDVLRQTFGTSPDWLELRVLDSTGPRAVARTVDDLDPLSTLFIVRRSRARRPSRSRSSPMRGTASGRRSGSTMRRDRRRQASSWPSSPTRAGASGRSPTTMRSGRCSSTRRTSADATRR